MPQLSDRLLRSLAERDPALVEHLRVAADLLDRPGGISLKLAAHALREFAAVMPAALGLSPQRSEGDTQTLRQLAPRWRELPSAEDSRPLYESMYSGSAYSETTLGQHVSIPEDLYTETRQAYLALGDEATFGKVMAAMVRMLDPLGDPTYHDEVAPGVRHWLRLHNWFVGKCHGRDLSALERDRATFHDKWRLYETTLTAIFGRVIDTLPELTELSKLPPDTPGVFDRVLALLKKAEHRRRFFLELNDPRWLSPLVDAEFFESPYRAVEADGLITFPQWPQSLYLSKIADRVPAEVANLARQLAPKTDNATIQADLIQASLAMPADIAATLVGCFGEWLKVGARLRVPLLLGNLGAKLAREGKASAALKLLRALLWFDRPAGGDRYLRRVIPRTGRYEYEMTLKEVEAALTPVAGAKLLDLLVRNLSAAIAQENGSEPEDHSWIWLASLESGDEYSNGVKEALASAVVRVALAEAARGSEPCARTLGRLGRESFHFYRRVELRVLAGETWMPELVQSRLASRELFDDERSRPEFELLLAATWTRLPPETRSGVLDWIVAGPDQTWLIEREQEERGAPPSAQVLQEHREKWQMARLAPIAAQLGTAERDLLEDLQNRKVEAAPQPIRGVVTWAGPTSPVSEVELAVKPPREVLAFLRSWQPNDDWMSPSREGLGRVLTQVVTASPSIWSNEATEFESDFDPTYVRGFLEGLNTAAGSVSAPLDWGSVLALCDWVARQPRDFPEGSRREREEDPHWGWTRRTIASLLQRGLRRDPSIPFEHRDEVWTILELLSTDPDPEPDDAPEAAKAVSRDAEIVALNSVRGTVLHAAVEYALWCARNLKAAGRAPATWFAEVPEALGLFDATLDPGSERCSAVPTVFSHYLPNLLYLDRSWLERQMPRLFGDLGPAWHVYLLYAQIHGAVIHLLAPYYLQAARAAGSPSEHEERKELARRLPEHLLVLHAHLHAQVPQTDEILHEFFVHAPAKQRAHLISFAAWHVADSADIPPAAVERIMRLVENRVNWAISAEGDAEELSDWAPLCRAEAFPDEWVLSVAKRAIPANPGGGFQEWIAERMARIADSDLGGALDVLQLVSERELEPMGIHAWGSPGERILSLAVAAGGALKARAVTTVSNFSERGYSLFERLLPGGDGS